MKSKVHSENSQVITTARNLRGISLKKKQTFRSQNSQSLNALMKSVNSGGQSQGNKLFRSKVFSMNTIKSSSIRRIHKAGPYDKFVKELNIKLPTPSDKFLQFLKIPPFNRLKNHVDFLTHMLQKNYRFFENCPLTIIEEIAKKIIIIDLEQIPKNHMMIVDEGIVHYQGRVIERGKLISRKTFIKNQFSCDIVHARLIGFAHHQYNAFTTNYFNSNIERFKRFLSNMQLFRIFGEQALLKIFSSLSLQFYTKGENLYLPGDQANDLFVIYSGKAVRKVIVEIDQTNKIPLEKYSKLIKVMSKSYEHKIQFCSEDLIGVAEIIDKLPHRTDEILVEEDCTVLVIERHAIQQNLDEYIIDRLNKYNLKKYPKNYDKLCQTYLKEKVQTRRAEERKIAALKDEMGRNSNEKRTQKIQSMIKHYQERIKMKSKENLIFSKGLQRVVNNDTS